MSSRSVAAEHDGGDARLVVLLAAVAGGDRAALARLYDATAPAALALARSLVVDDDDAAEDVVVAAFRLVWAEAPRRAGRCRSVTAWVLALTWRCAQVDRGAPEQPLTSR